ncbi:MAG: hypothetical protein H6703_08900 [Myxococcales bacterium]|nr:hypothetical protein [Myxococcales bacterium]
MDELLGRAMTDQPTEAGVGEAPAEPIDPPAEAPRPRWKLVARSRIGGGERRTSVDIQTAQSPIANAVRTMFDQLRPLDRQGPFALVQGDKRREIQSLKGLLDELLAAGRKGMDIQRYKGLGEMNPEQLWETTMDPENRTLLQVRIDDSVEADEIFTVLMGDTVEPRREFIEKNALDVKNLDV